MERPFSPTHPQDGGTHGAHWRQTGYPIEYEYGCPATPLQMRNLEDCDYKGWPVAWEYLTQRQADTLLKRYAKREPLWQPEKPSLDDDPAARQAQLPLGMRTPATTSRRPHQGKALL